MDPQHLYGGGAGGTADSGGGERPEGSLEAAAAGRGVGVGGVWGVVEQLLTPIPFEDPSESAQTGVSGPRHRSLQPWPEIPVLGAETSVRPESPAWKAGVSGPTDSKSQVLMCFGHAKARGAVFKMR